MKPYGYDFDRTVFEQMTAHQQEIFITREADEAQLIEILNFYPSPDNYALVASRNIDKADRIIAGARITRSETLSYLSHSQHRNVYVLRLLAENENTPEFVLSRLVSPHCPDKMTRIYAWRNPSLSPDDRTPENDPMGRE